MDPQSQPPQSAQPAVMGRYGFPRDNRTLVKAVVVLFILEAILKIPITVIGAIEVHTLDTPEGLDNFDQGGDSRWDFVWYWIGIPYLWIWVSLMAFYCIWKNRSCKNAWLLNPEAMKTTPAWSVAWYFIPIMNLFKPYQAMREIRNASCASGKLSIALPVWWTLWIISSTTDSIKMFLEVDAVDEYKMLALVDIVLLPLSLILTCAIVRIVLTITAAQMPRLQALTPDDVPQTPPGHQPPAH